MRKTILFALLFLSVSCSMAAEQLTYRTKELHRLATILSIKGTQLQEGSNQITVNGTLLSVRVNRHEVEHIGIFLFSEDIRKADHSPVFDFLERYFLQLKYPPVVKSASMMTRDDQFQFIHGSLSMVEKLLPTDVFMYNYDRYRYTASWSRNGKPLLSVSFPVEYQLMSGENKIEAENLLMSDIQNTPVTSQGYDKSSSSNDTYINNDFSTRLYFSKGQLISSLSHPAETAANIMLSPFVEGSYRLQITQRKYGFQKTTFEVPLLQWLAFCKSHGCRLYFGVENITDDGTVTAVVIAVNTAENYNHVLTATLTPDIIGQQGGLIRAQLYPFIPTHSVMNLFSKTYKKSKKKIFR